MNDGIPKEICSLRHPTIDLAIGQILQLGGRTQLSKLDIKDAYRIVPEHPQDWKLLGLFWKGSYYIDTRLPFGLGSAPKYLPMKHSGSLCSGGWAIACTTWTISSS